MNALTLLTVLGTAGLLTMLGCTADDSGTGGTGGSGNTGNTGNTGGSGNTGNTGNTGGTGNAGGHGGSGNIGNTGGHGGAGGAEPVCGNGHIEGSEVCDDGNTAAGDGCSALCAVETGFDCTVADPSVCTAICGDFLLLGTEQCDDGNTAAGDGCSDTCTFEATCGNGDIEPGEQCDDGNTTPSDGCSATCQLESGSTCGDAINLNDPANVTIVDGATVYSGDTTGSGLTNFGDPSCSAGTTGSPTRVLRYTTSMPATVTLETVAVDGSALTDTVVWAYLDCLGPATELACNDDLAQGNTYSLAATDPLPAGTTVYIVVSGYHVADVGAYELHVTETPYQVVPSSGTCAAPTVIGAGQYTGETLQGDPNNIIDASCVGDLAPEAVYQLTLATEADVYIVAQGLPADDTGMDLGIYVYATNCGTLADEVGCTDGHVWTPENLDLIGLAAGTYYIVVDGFEGAYGPYTLGVRIVEVLAEGAACVPDDPATRCPDGTECLGALGSETCLAPIFFQNFTNGLPPCTVTDSGADAHSWELCDPAAVCTYTNGTGSASGGAFATVVDESGVVMDGEMLVTSALDATGDTVVTLEFDHDFSHWSTCNDQGAVEVSTNGTTWTAVATYVADDTGHKSIDISTQAAGQAAFYVRFNYDDDTTGANPCFANYWDVDDISIMAY